MSEQLVPCCQMRPAPCGRCLCPSTAWSDELIPGCSKRCHQLADPVGVYGRGAIALPPPMFSQCSDRVFTERRKRGKLWTREDLECRV